MEYIYIYIYCLFKKNIYIYIVRNMDKYINMDIYIVLFLPYGYHICILYEIIYYIAAARCNNSEIFMAV